MGEWAGGAGLVPGEDRGGGNEREGTRSHLLVFCAMVLKVMLEVRPVLSTYF